MSCTQEVQRVSRVLPFRAIRWYLWVLVPHRLHEPE
jgi:hypothetical protein